MTGGKTGSGYKSESTARRYEKLRKINENIIRKIFQLKKRVCMLLSSTVEKLKK